MIYALFANLPLTLWLIIFWYWKNIVVHSAASNDDIDPTSGIFSILLSFYVILIEASKIWVQEAVNMKQKFFSFTENAFGNIMGFLAPICVIICVSWSDIADEKFWRMLSLTSFCAWIRFALNLRSSRRLNWMILLISRSIYSIRYFLVVLAIGIFAFADAFFAIERILMLQGDIPPVRLTDDMTIFERYIAGPVRAWQSSYLVTLGDFSDELEFYGEYEWIVFFLATVFNLIIMLNLLISIIGETYGTISANRLQTSYREKAVIVNSRNNSLIGLIGKSDHDVNETIYIA